MKTQMITITLLVMLSISGCYLPINGRVVDAETQQPIEGAIVLVEWTKKHGFGDAWTESYKVVEVVSDKEGRVKIDGCNSLFVEQPDITVYKKGYVAWNDERIFPSYDRRTDFRWGNVVFKLEQFKEDYSYIAHTDYIRFSINSSLNFEVKRHIYNAFSWEDQMASKERDRQSRKQ